MLRSILGVFMLLLLALSIAGTTSAADRNKEKPPAPTLAEIEAREQVHQALLAETLGDNTARSKCLSTAWTDQPQLAEANWHLGRVQFGDKWLSLGEAETAAAEDANLRKYRQQRDAAKNPRMLQALARWCGKMDLDEASKLHYAQLLTRTDSTDDMCKEAIKKLELQFAGSAWTTRKELDDRQEKLGAVQDAFSKWLPDLVKLQAAINGSEFQVRDKAIAKFHQIDDPAIVPVLESFIFAGGGRFGEEIVNRLSKFSGAESTEALTRFAVFSEDFIVRKAASEQLQSRPLHDYLPLLLSALVSPIQSQHRIETDSSGAVSYFHVVSRESPAANQVAMTGQVARPEEYASGLPVRGGVRQSIRDALHEEQVSAATTVAHNVELEVYLANLQQRPRNERVFAVLEQTTQQKLPRDPPSWWKWWQEYNETYWPKPTQYVWGRREHVYLMPRLSSCFLAGTSVRTQSGLVAIETIQPGDKVLSQDQDTGELAYKLVLRTTLRPPADLVKIKAGSEEISTTLGHPFWVNGHGWKMAKQLKEGDLLHSVGGAVRVDAVEPLAKQQAHNLVVADFNTYFVGNQGLLVHDNEYRKPTRAIVPGLVAD